MTALDEKLQKSDWVRFQVPDHRVLEGFVQAFSEDGTRILVGKTPDSQENQWHDLRGIVIIKKQALGTPV